MSLDKLHSTIYHAAAFAFLRQLFTFTGIDSTEGSTLMVTEGSTWTCVGSIGGGVLSGAVCVSRAGGCVSASNSKWSMSGEMK